MTKNPYQRVDHRTLAARARGYPARSVFKLEEIDRRYHLFKAGNEVLDLGAAPGSWTLYAADKVGPNGRVVAVDLKPVTVPLPANVRALAGDALSLSAEVEESLGLFDVVVSDMAPSTTGSKVRDQTGSFELFSMALGLAERLGRKGSHFVAKLFMSPDFSKARANVAERYDKVFIVRPSGTRKPSSEVFIVGMKASKQG